MNMKDYINVTNRIEIDDKCKEEVFSAMNNKQRKNIKFKSKRKILAMSISVAVLACTGTVVFASEMGVFDKLKGNQERTVINDNGIKMQVDKYDKNNYDLIKEHAVEVTESVEVNENLSVNVESVYCDGTNLILGITARFDKPEDITTADKLLFYPTIDVNGKHYTTFYDCEGILRLNGQLIIDEGSENTYLGTIEMSLAPEHKLTEPTTAEITLSSITCVDYTHETTGELEDNVVFSVDIVPDTSNVSTPNLYVEEDDFKFRIYEITPASINIGTDYPEWYDLDTQTKEIYSPNGELEGIGPKYSIVSICYDDQGNQIPGLGVTAMPDYHDDLIPGILSSCDTSSITIKFVNKQESDENGEPVVLKELTLDLP